MDNPYAGQCMRCGAYVPNVVFLCPKCKYAPVRKALVRGAFLGPIILLAVAYFGARLTGVSMPGWVFWAVALVGLIVGAMVSQLIYIAMWRRAQ